MSEVPLTLTQLKTEFGKSMLMATLEAYDISNDFTRPIVIDMPHDDLIEVVDEWRKANLKEVKAVSLLAHRILVRLPGDLGNALASIRSDLKQELSGVQDILSPKGRYLGAVCDRLDEQPLENVEKYLKVLVAYCSGE
jgi:hypothetical protein